MKHRSLMALLALLALGPGACRDDKPAPRPDRMTDASVDVPRTDATVPVDSALDRATPAPDSATVDSGATDAVSGEVKGPDLGGMDAAPDITTADVSQNGRDAGHDVGPDLRDATADAVVTCGPGIPRDMLCLTYCDGVGRFCSGDSSQYRNADECRAACNAPTWACGKSGDTTGNSLYCRLAHTALAGLGAAATECPNAGPNSPGCQ
jgi:hypothetical protein